MYIRDAGGADGEWNRDAAGAELRAAPLSAHHFVLVRRVFVHRARSQELDLGLPHSPVILPPSCGKTCTIYVSENICCISQAYFLIRGGGSRVSIQAF